STGVWAPEFPKINGTVLVAVPDGGGGFYIGGDFSRVGTKSRHNGARVIPGATPGTWDVGGWNPETDKPIRSIALSPNSNVAYIGGDFAMVQGVARAGIAAVNSFSGDPILTFDPGAGTGIMVGTGAAATLNVGPVMSVVVSADGTRLFAGGFFTSMAGVARSGLAALNAATGALDAAFNPSPSAGGVETMALTASGRLLLGGGFTKIGAVDRSRLAAVNAGTGALDAAWAPAADGTVHAMRLSADGSNVYVAGAFANIGTSGRSRLALLAAAGSGALDATWKPAADADVSALALSADGARLLAAGAFTKLGGAAPGQPGRLRRRHRRARPRLRRQHRQHGAGHRRLGRRVQPVHRRFVQEGQRREPFPAGQAQRLDRRGRRRVGPESQRRGQGRGRGRHQGLLRGRFLHRQRIDPQARRRR
ncbi:MAG: hypothetical protein LC792_13760, partial [Actinobacteria bacterium]|nr:hypothetical protein [Actinomycetota bacterium]